MFCERVPMGSRASSTWMMTSDESITCGSDNGLGVTSTKCKFRQTCSPDENLLIHQVWEGHGKLTSRPVAEGHQMLRRKKNENHIDRLFTNHPTLTEWGKKTKIGHEVSLTIRTSCYLASTFWPWTGPWVDLAWNIPWKHAGFGYLIEFTPNPFGLALLEDLLTSFIPGSTSKNWLMTMVTRDRRESKPSEATTLC